MAVPHPIWREDRIAPRDDTWRRVRVSDAAGVRLPVLVVNLSPHGLMARVDESLAVGDRLIFDLPHLGAWRGEVRWSLGGRIGCKFDRDVMDEDYVRLLSMMR